MQSSQKPKVESSNQRDHLPSIDSHRNKNGERGFDNGAAFNRATSPAAEEEKDNGSELINAEQAR